MLNWKFNPPRGPIGLDIGERWIKAVQLSADASRIHAVVSVARTPGENASLTAHECRRLVTILSRRGFLGRRAVVAVPSGAVMSSILELPPPTSPAPRHEIARTELADAHRRDPQAMEVDFWDIPAPARRTEGSPAMAAGCTHEDAERLLDPLERAGLRVEALDLPCWAVARLAAAAPSTSDHDSAALSDQTAGQDHESGHDSEAAPHAASIVAAVDLGWSSATLILLHQGTVVYERNLPTAGLHHLATSLEKQHRFQPDVIEYLLRDLGFGVGDTTDDDLALLRKVRGPFDTHFTSLGQELSLSASYAQHQYPQAQVQQVVLTGGGAAVPGVESYLAGHLECPVRALSPLDRLACHPALHDEAGSPTLAIAAGLAMHDLKEVARCAA